MNELERAIEDLAAAARKVRNIAPLPRDVGSKIQWIHNELVWERVGDDAWTNSQEKVDSFRPKVYSSSFVGSFDWIRA